MPRFHFSVHERLAPDDDGLDMPDAATACQAALMAVAEMLEDVASAGGESVVLYVRDDQGRRACAVTARISVA